jgi:hypothetical protein
MAAGLGVLQEKKLQVFFRFRLETGSVTSATFC